LRLIDFVYHSNLGLSVIKKKRDAVLDAEPPLPLASGRDGGVESERERVRARVRERERER